MSKRLPKKGFTLVELLVVIGIIALLISVLLPALNRAKEQANLVVCESNLRQVGSMVQIYATENHGYYPYGWAEMLPGTENKGVYNGWWDTPCWGWADSLQRLTNNKAPGDGGTPAWAATLGGVVANEQNMAIDYSPVFHDSDTAGLGYQQRVSDFMANPIIFPDTNILDPRMVASGGTGCCPLRQASGIKRSSATMMIWCGPQQLTNGVSAGYIYNDGPLALQLDQSTLEGGTYGLYYPTPANAGYPRADYDLPISIGNVVMPPLPPGVQLGYNGGNPVKLPLLKWLNNDDIATNYSANCAMRFRHMNNTTTNALFCDGHVESRALGTVTAMDVSVNTAPPPAKQAGQ
jgi:prepilin-type N-terminal cleavage/methylation domain-containing protein/prepilin-type processing-associated H-X9-DG protein